MFDSLSSRLNGVFDRLQRRANLSEQDVNDAMREVRVALLEADVALPVVKDFVDTVRARAVGQEVIKSVTPGQMVIKIVNDVLVETLGSDGTGLDLGAAPPVAILMVGLQGSGKTTTTGKLGLWLTKRERKKVLMASLDVYRPAAQEQLAQVGRQTGVATLPIVPGQQPEDIAIRAMEAGRLEGYDVVILDTAGRLHIDGALMDEVADIRDSARPRETLLVTDSMMGQDAVTVAREFNDQIGITGIVLTRIDGDARGGAALSMRAVTGRPIKFLGTGEKMDGLEAFHPDRVAGRILGMGDVVSLVEKAAETIEQDTAERLAKRMSKGEFDLEDMLAQFRQIKKMGSIKGLLGMLPGMGQMGKALKNADIDDAQIARQEAIILSMTRYERQKPHIIKMSRKQRIAKGSGVTVNDVNKLLKQYDQMTGMMKKLKKHGGLEALAGGMPGMAGAGSEMASDAGLGAGAGAGAGLGAGLGSGLGGGGLPGLGGGAGAGLPGLGGGLPGLGAPTGRSRPTKSQKKKRRK